jgi:hypothetical protein
VVKAEFGLSSQSVAGQLALVPSWLFTVEQAGADHAFTLVQVAVDPVYITRAVPAQDLPTSAPDAPGAPTSAPGDGGGDSGSEPMRAESYAVDGRTLTVRFWGGVCEDYTVRAKESADRVEVTVTGKERDPGAACMAIARRFDEPVRLKEPLGDRAVVDAPTGERLRQPRK